MAILGGACALNGPAPQRLVEVRVQVRELADGEARDPTKLYDNFAELSEPLPRGIVLERAHVGEVLVKGIWTVIYWLAADDVRWLFGHHDQENGYFIGMASKPEAEALLAHLPVRHRDR